MKKLLVFLFIVTLTWALKSCKQYQSDDFEIKIVHETPEHEIVALYYKKGFIQYYVLRKSEDSLIENHSKIQ